MATVLGVGDNNGSDTLTVTLTTAQPAGSFVHVIHAAGLQNLTFFDSPSEVGLPSDSLGGTWRAVVGTPKLPVLGATSDTNTGASSGSRAGLQIGDTAMRVSGSTLGAGDTVTVTWNDNGEGASHMVIIAMIIAFGVEYPDTAVSQYIGGTTPGDFVGVYYANGNSNSLMGPFDGHTLNWGTAGLDLPYPHDAAKMLTGVATWPATSSYTPARGTKIAEHSSADSKLTIAAALASAPALTAIEPGGAFSGSSVSIMVANYQFTVAPSGGLYAWQGF